MGAALKTFTTSSPSIQSSSTVPSVSQVHDVMHLLNPISLGHFKVLTLRFDLLFFILKKKKRSIFSLWASPVHCAVGLFWRSFTKPKKQHVDRNDDKPKAALTSPAMATVPSTAAMTLLLL